MQGDLRFAACAVFMFLFLEQYKKLAALALQKQSNIGG
jgi:hypothetical protein